jgi:hypothetical protein
MLKIVTQTIAAAAIAGMMACSGAAPAAAQVAGPRVAAQFKSQASDVTTVRWRRGWGGHHGWGWRRGWGWGPAFGAGLLLGGALYAPRYYYYDPYPYGAYPAVPAGSAVTYCMRRFRSYDPYSRTYLGFDGLRHPCP